MLYTQYIHPKGDLISEISKLSGRSGDSGVPSNDHYCGALDFNYFQTFWSGNNKFYPGNSTECSIVNDQKL